MTEDFRKLRNIRKTSNQDGNIHSVVPSLPSRKQIIAIAVKKHATEGIKRFLSCPILQDFPILFQIFCQGL